MNKAAKENIRALLILLLLAIIFLWPVSFELFTFKNDALTYYYPIRTLISDALNNGELPLWTPFINLGYPIHADFQSGAWNPIIWIFSLTTKYPLVAMHYECLVYFVIAGFGMFRLCREMNTGFWLSLICGISFQFSGFMLDTVQFFTAISSICWVPLLFLYFKRMLHDEGFSSTVWFSLTFAMMLLCGYPAFLIICSYLLIGYFVYSIFEKRGLHIKWSRIILRPSLSVFLFLLFTAPAIISFYQHIPFISRGGGQSLAVVQENSMNPATLVSLLFPYSSQSADGFLHSDPLMRTVYMGILPLCIFLMIFFNRSSKIKKHTILLFVLAAVMLLLAFGKYFLLRKFAYYILPGMDMFRHPALFRSFFIFFLLAGIASAFPNASFDQKKLKKPALTILIIGASMFILSAIVLLSKGDSLFEYNSKFFLSSGFWQRMIPESLLVILISLSIWYTSKRSLSFIVAALVLDLFISTQLHLPITVIGSKSYATVTSDLNRNPVLFPLPGNSSLAENSKNSYNNGFEGGSRMPYRKLVGRNAYFITPGNLNTQQQFYDSEIRDSIMQKPLLSFFHKQGNITVESMGANRISGVYSLSAPDSILYIQNHYLNWKAAIDGKPVTITTSAISFMSIPALKGNHHFMFRYHPNFLSWALWLPFAGIVIAGVVLIFSTNRRGKRQTGNG